MQKFIERMNCIENSDVWFGKRLTRKSGWMVIIGHVDGVQHVAGILWIFLTGWASICPGYDRFVGWHRTMRYHERLGRDTEQSYTQEDLVNMVHSVLRLSYDIKNSDRELITTGRNLNDMLLSLSGNRKRLILQCTKIWYLIPDILSIWYLCRFLFFHILINIASWFVY